MVVGLVETLASPASKVGGTYVPMRDIGGTPGTAEPVGNEGLEGMEGASEFACRWEGNEGRDAVDVAEEGARGVRKLPMWGLVAGTLDTHPVPGTTRARVGSVLLQEV